MGHTEKALWACVLESDQTAIGALCDWYEEHNLPEGVTSLRAVYPFPGALIILMVKGPRENAQPILNLCHDLIDKFPKVKVVAIPEDFNIELLEVGEKDALVLRVPSVAQKGTILATKRSLKEVFPNHRVLYAYYEVGVAPACEDFERAWLLGQR
jgi:hypothetical protein